MKKSLFLATLTGAAALVGTAASAATAFDYNVVAFGTFTSQNTEVNGALAVGGNATLTNFSVGKDLDSDYAGSALVVGGNLTYTNGQVFRGDATVGGNISGSGFAVPNGTASSHAAVPFDFAGEYAQLTGLSAGWAGMAANGSVATGGSYVFTGTDADLNVFDISTSALASSSGFSVYIPDGSVAVFNVTGTSFTSNWPGSFYLNDELIINHAPEGGSSLLFNFVDATSLTLNGSWAGTILAPDANVTLNWGGIFGSLYANNVTSTSEFYMAGFKGGSEPSDPGVPAVPEPATWAMMILGFGVVGMAARRRRTAFA